MAILPKIAAMPEGHINYMPKWMSNKAMTIYALSVFAVLVLIRHPMEWYFYLFGIAEVGGFFYYGNKLSRKWATIPTSKRFEKKLFRTALIIRLVAVVFLYGFFILMTGDSFEFNAGDVMFYDEMAREFARQFANGNFHILYESYSGSSDISDMGYAVYLGFVYLLTGNSILMARLLKALYSAYTCVLIYRSAQRNFGENVARIAAIFVMLMPNLIFYCGLHLKETEMVFLFVLFVERSEGILSSRKFDIWQVLPTILIGISLFFLRTALAAVAFLALFMALAMTSSRVVGWGKRITVGLLVVGFLGAGFGDRFIREANNLYQQRASDSSYQAKNMEWRSNRVDAGGYSNKFIKYAGTSVFAPLIFTIPFPSMSFTYGQENQRQIHGGNFVKNVTSGLTIFSLFMLLFSGEWRKHIFPAAAMIGYLLVLTMSAFAASERFHLPSLPFELMFAALGLSIASTSPTYKKWFNYWTIFCFVAAIGWNWFKLRGRGMI